jgi:tetratricopeptide (TPR) repeat protein
MIFTCRNRADWRRAAEWTERFNRLCDEAGLASFPGTCRLHRAELLHVGGALSEALGEASRVCEELARNAPWAEGDGYQLVGDLHLARGALDAAETAYQRAHELGWDPQPGLALLHLARGRARAGLRALQRTLAANDWSSRQRRGLLLSNLVPIALAANAPEVAREALDELDGHPELWHTPGLQAAVTEARAALLRHEGDPVSAAIAWRRAVHLHQEAHSPLAAARARIRLADALLAQEDAEGAELELHAAERALSGSGAAPLEMELRAVRERLCG